MMNTRSSSNRITQNQPEFMHIDVSDIYWNGDQEDHIHGSELKNVRILHEQGWFSDGTITEILIQNNQSRADYKYLKRIAPKLKAYVKLRHIHEPLLFPRA